MRIFVTNDKYAECLEYVINNTDVEMKITFKGDLANKQIDDILCECENIDTINVLANSIVTEINIINEIRVLNVQDCSALQNVFISSNVFKIDIRNCTNIKNFILHNTSTNLLILTNSIIHKLICTYVYIIEFKGDSIIRSCLNNVDCAYLIFTNYLNDPNNISKNIIAICVCFSDCRYLTTYYINENVKNCAITNSNISKFTIDMPKLTTLKLSKIKDVNFEYFNKCKQPINLTLTNCENIKQ